MGLVKKYFFFVPRFPLLARKFSEKLLMSLQTDEKQTLLINKPKKVWHQSFNPIFLKRIKKIRTSRTSPDLCQVVSLYQIQMGIGTFMSGPESIPPCKKAPFSSSQPFFTVISFEEFEFSASLRRTTKDRNKDWQNRFHPNNRTS